MRLIAVFIARGWLVLTLTGSPFWVGVAVAMRGGTHIAVGMFAGVLLDRVNRRWMLFMAELGISITALAIGLLILVGRIELWHVLVASVLEGVFVAVRWPAINTMMYEAVGPKRLLNASATQMLGFNLGHIVAAAATGQLIEAFGTESAYFFATGCGLTGAFLLLFVRGSFKPQASPEKFGHALRSGLRYIWGHGSLRQLITLSFIMSLLGWSHISMMPVMARDVLGVGASGLGFLASTGALGALVATSVIAGLGDYKNKANLLMFNAATVGTMLILFALSTWYPLSLLLKAILQGGLMAFEATLLTLVQLVTSNDMRGRVQGIYSLVFGFTWLGALVMGGIATLSNAPLAIGSGGVAIVLVILFLWRPLSRVRFVD